ncbi:MAG: bacillithiol biosynthesis cysteine-adding enzyme BshC [Acidobacteriota bacterium]|nr:bacillithiol biosynthesis cysteine-adding enzyme BshC [Acidobacteriota bacterium]
MKSQCLPFNQIPHTTRLFNDFIAYSPKVHQFYPHSPRFSEWFKEEAAKLRYDPPRREQVASILAAQNRSWDASSATLANIERLRKGAAAVVTGQQVGLFGGPLFSLFKALSAVKLAEEATQAGVETVPIFWLATEDHDLEEINGVNFPGPQGALKNLKVPLDTLPDAPVGTIKFGSEIGTVVQAAVELLGESDVTKFLGESYREGESFGGAFARLFSRIFAEWGVILLDAADPKFHRIAEPVYRSAIEKAAELDEALLARGKEIEAAGYHQQVKVTPSTTLLFTLQRGARISVHRRSGVTADLDTFTAGEKQLQLPELAAQVSSNPENFSPNVLLRPVVQDYLLPTIAYVGGSAEIAYFAQVKVVYEALLGRVTPVVPRFSATLIEAKPQELLQRYRAQIHDVFRGTEALRETLGSQTLSAEVHFAFTAAEAALEKSMAEVRDALSRLDKTLVDSAVNAESKIRHQLDSLRSRAARAELRHSEVLERHADLLSNALYPSKGLQERGLAGIYFLARYGMELLKDLHHAIHTDCLDHQVITL